jgi:murein hydrolase activator
VALLLALALAQAAASPPPGPAASNPRQRLKAVGEQLQQEKLDVERLQGEESSLLDAIDAAEKAEAQAAQAAVDAESRRARAAEALAAAQASERAARAEADARLAGLAPRLRVWQRLSPDRRVSLLLGAGSAEQAEARRRLFRSILGGQLSELRGALAALGAAQAARTAAEGLASDLETREHEAHAARAAAAAAKARHAALLAAVRTERALHQKAMTELARAQGQLAKVVAALPPLKMVGTGFALAKGRLPRPVDGPIEVGFGEILNPRFNTVTLQKGLDIRAPEGAPVRAVHEGRVVYAGLLQGYGNLLIVDHGDGFFTLFAHLETLEKGVDDVVAAGDEIAKVGQTGSLKGPYLYFEIRRHGQPLDPAPWLAPPATAGR